MSIPIKPRKSSRVRAAAAANPEFDEARLSERLGLSQREGKVILKADPRRRTKSTAPIR